jgi:hypothetical protein
MFDGCMLDPIDRQPRGFLGRPLIGLLFAVAVGGLVSYTGSRLHLSPIVVFLIIVGIVGMVAYLWHRADEKKSRP